MINRMWVGLRIYVIKLFLTTYREWVTLHSENESHGFISYDHIHSLSVPLYNLVLGILTHFSNSLWETLNFVQGNLITFHDSASKQYLQFVLEASHINIFHNQQTVSHTAMNICLKVIFITLSTVCEWYALFVLWKTISSHVSIWSTECE